WALLFSVWNRSAHERATLAVGGFAATDGPAPGEPAPGRRRMAARGAAVGCRRGCRAGVGGADIALRGGRNAKSGAGCGPGPDAGATPERAARPARKGQRL